MAQGGSRASLALCAAFYAVSSRINRLSRSAIFWAGVWLIVSVAVAALRREPVMFVEATTRYIEQLVTNGTTSAIRFVAPVVVYRGDGTQPRCFTGLLVPEPGAELAYRVQDGLLIIHGADGAPFRAHLVDSSQPDVPDALNARTRIVYGATKRNARALHLPECAVHDEDIPEVRLPIWGPTRLGRLATAATASARHRPDHGELLGGTVKVYGRALLSKEIYAAGTIDLPRGTRLDAGDGAANVAAWFGAARFSPEQNGQEARLEITASVQAPHLVLTREGDQQPFVYIDAGFSERLLGESLFVALTFLIGGLVLWMQIIDGWLKLFGKARNRNGED